MAKTWIDENGLEIPASRVTSVEKKRERGAEKLLREASKINEKLSAFKEMMTEICDEVWRESMEEAGANPEAHKGNHTWYNFDRSIKVEVSISERIDFDDVLIEAAKQKFEEFLEKNTSGVEEMIRQLIMDAFNNTKGKLDAKRVMTLVRYRQRISPQKYPNFHEAVDLIEQSIRRPDSRKYFRIWQRDASGEYQNIDLNFSSI